MRPLSTLLLLGATIVACATANDVSLHGHAQPGDHTKSSERLSNAVRAGCDLAYAIAANSSGVSVAVERGGSRDGDSRAAVLDCRVTAAGAYSKVTEEGGDAASRLQFGFSARQWGELEAYTESRDDGKRFGFSKWGVTCLFQETRRPRPGSPKHDRDLYDIVVSCSASSLE